jgi:hypothetical protein
MNRNNSDWLKVQESGNCIIYKHRRKSPKYDTKVIDLVANEVRYLKAGIILWIQPVLSHISKLT